MDEKPQPLDYATPKPRTLRFAMHWGGWVLALLAVIVLVSILA
jgi:hypothetical protein